MPLVIPIVAQLPGYMPLEAIAMSTGPLFLFWQSFCAAERPRAKAASRNPQEAACADEPDAESSSKGAKRCTSVPKKERRTTQLPRVAAACVAAADCEQVWNDWTAWFYHRGHQMGSWYLRSTPASVLFLALKLLLGSVQCCNTFNEWFRLLRRNA